MFLHFTCDSLTRVSIIVQRMNITPNERNIHGKRKNKNRTPIYNKNDLASVFSNYAAMEEGASRKWGEGVMIICWNLVR